ncbi:MAG: LacI family DNA-binding transcriptional regulator [Terrimicrobiaceae bacterium]
MASVMEIATQSTLADTLGVSVRSVSAVLGNGQSTSSRVGAATRERILKAAQGLNYRAHRQAQLLRGVKSGVIGIIKPTSLLQTAVERSYFVSQAIQEAGYGLLVNEILWEEKGGHRAVEAMLDARVEGVLFLGDVSPDAAVPAERQQLSRAKIPMVALGSTHLPGILTVAVDCRQGMRDLTRHLLTLGYRRLTLALPVSPEETGVPSPWGFAERQAGFQEAADAAGLSETQARVLHLAPSDNWRDNYAIGREVILRLIESGERPEVLLCSSDNMAIGAMAACVDAGWKVPDDIAITGFDGITLGQYSRPALTTVAQPTEAIGKKAVELLLKKMRGETLPTNELVKLPCHVVVRASCGSKPSLALSLPTQSA